MKANIGRTFARGLAVGSLLAVPSVYQSPSSIHSHVSVFPESLCLYQGSFKDRTAEYTTTWHQAEMNNVSTDTIRYTKTSFCYDQYSYINFHEPFQLKFSNGNVTLCPWGISFPCQDIGMFDKALVGFLQDLMEKALADALSKQEKADWMAMLKLFDYKQFRQDYSPAVYEEFQIKSIDEKGRKVVLIRQDGKRSTCPLTISPCFSNGRFKAGDSMGAMVKRNHLDVIVDISGERIIRDELVSDEEWGKIEAI